VFIFLISKVFIVGVVGVVVVVVVVVCFFSSLDEFLLSLEEAANSQQ
jgi:hypothetical protein